MSSLSLQTLRQWQRNSPARRVFQAVGLVRAGRWLYHFRNRRRLTRGFTVATLAGRHVTVLTTSMSELLRVDEWLEDHFLREVLAAIHPGDVVYDVGANIGVFSLAAAAHHESIGVQVHAFEPEPRNAEHLRANVRANGFRAITVHEIALSDEAGEGELYVTGETGGGMHSILSHHASQRPAVKIRLVTGDEFVRGGAAPPPTVLKIDVEGAEMEVLMGFERYLRGRSVRDLFVEIHPPRIRHSKGKTEGHILAWLAQRGYHSVWRVNEGVQIYHHLTAR